MIKSIANHKKRYAILLVYFLIFFYVILLRGYAWSALLLPYVVVTVVLLLAHYSNVIAVLGNYYYASGKTEQGLRLLKLAIDQKTKSPAAHLNYAIHLVKNGNANEAMALLKKAQSLKHGVLIDKNILLTMGSCYWVMDDVDSAIDVLEGLRKKYDYVNCHVLTTLGYMYIVKGDAEKSRAITELAIQDDPNSGSAWDNMGQIEYRDGNIDKAKECFSKAVSLKDDLPDSYFYLGVIAKNENAEQAANGYFEKALSCNISALNTVTREQIEKEII